MCMSRVTCRQLQSKKPTFEYLHDFSCKCKYMQITNIIRSGETKLEFLCFKPHVS